MLYKKLLVKMNFKMISTIRILLVLMAMLIVSCNKEDSPSEPSTYGEISGIVIDQKENAPLARVSVYTTPATSFVSTNDEGRYSISNIEPGEYSVTAIKNGFDSLTVGVSVTSGAAATADLILTKIDSINISTFGSISGNVFNGISGESINAVNLSTVPSTGSKRSDENGQFLFENLLAGEYKLTAEKNGFITEVTTLLVSNGLTTSAEIEMMPEDTSTANTKGNLFGKVINSVSEEPIKNVFISTTPSFGSVLTDSLGVFRINNIPEGNYIIIVNKLNYVDASEDITMVGGKTSELNFNLTPSVGSVSGIVIDSVGAPIQFVEITTDPETSAFITNSAGEFSIANVSVGNIKITASKQNYTTKVIDTVIQPGKVTEIVMVLLAP